MTIFGTDISSYQAGLDVAHLPDPFVLMKCTEDVGYVDADYPGWLAATKSAGKIPVAYHFIGPSDPAKQAAHLAAHIIDPAVAVMVDFEDEGSFHPTLAQLLALDDAIKAVNLRVKLNYFPKWKWGNLGSPSLAGLTQRSIGLVSSAYPNLTVAAAGQVYAAAGGDGGSGWASYGGVTPVLWQFSDRVSDGGQRVDMNAFRGTVQQFAALINGTTDLSTGGTDVSNIIPPSIAHHFPGLDLTPDFPANQPFDEPTADIWADARAEAAWRYGLANSQKLDQLLARPTPAPVDLAALETAIGSIMAGQLSHLTGGVDVPALATALAPELAAHLGLEVVAK